MKICEYADEGYHRLVENPAWTVAVINESAVTAAGTLYVRLVNVPDADAVPKSSIALFTVH